MKILRIISGMNLVAGGSSQSMFNLANGLLALGMNIKVRYFLNKKDCIEHISVLSSLLYIIK